MGHNIEFKYVSNGSVKGVIGENAEEEKAVLRNMEPHKNSLRMSGKHDFPIARRVVYVMPDDSSSWYYNAKFSQIFSRSDKKNWRNHSSSTKK